MKSTKRPYSKAAICAPAAAGCPGERPTATGQEGVYIVLLAILLVALVAVYGLVLDGSKLILSRLWAQRAADAGAISGAGMIARNPLAVALADGSIVYNPSSDIPPFTRRVARVALQNLFVRNVLEAADDGATVFQTMFTAGTASGTRATNGSVAVEATLAGNKVLVSVRFLNEFILMDFITKRLGLDVGAFAEAEVGSALVALVLDTSNSMNGFDGVSGMPKIERLKEAAKEFIEIFDQSQDRIGIFTFGSNAQIIKPFSRNPATGFNLIDLRNGIDGLTAGGATNMAGALLHVYDEFSEVKAALPTWYNAATTSVVLFSDGAPTATAVAFAQMGALPAVPTYDDFKVVFSANEAGQPLLPFRIVDSAALPMSAANDNGLPPGSIEPCSVLDSGWYSAAGSLGGCVSSLGFYHPAHPGVVFHGGLGINDYEALFHLSAIAYADVLRNSPERTLPTRPLGTTFYTIGLGETMPGCNAIGNPYENVGGGECADYRKDNTLSRIALDPFHTELVQLTWHNPFPANGLPQDSFGNGEYFMVPADTSDLVEIFRQVAQKIRLKLIQ